MREETIRLIEDHLSDEPQLVKEIAKKAGLNPVTVYEALGRLQDQKKVKWVGVHPRRYVRMEGGKKKEEEKTNKDLKYLIPSTCEAYTQRRIRKTTDLQILQRAYEKKLNTLLVGETGTGKTHVLRYLAYILKVPYMRVNLNGGTTVEDLVGQWIPHDGSFVWSDGVLVRLMKYGGLFVCDEINAAPAEILMVLNPLLDDEKKLVLVQKDGEVVHACPDFWFIATMNPDGDYEGVRPLNLALKDRFAVVLQYEYDSAVETKLLGAELAEIAKILRQRRDEVRTPVSTRGLLQYMKNKEIFGADIALELFVSKFDETEREVVKEIFKIKAKENSAASVEKETGE